MIEGTQNKLFAHWFSGSYIAFIFALDIAWNRVTSIFSRAASVPMSQINGFWGWALWIPTIACAVNLGLCLAYWGYERSVPRQYRPKLGRQARKKEGWDKRKFVFGYITHLPKFFWILCGTRERWHRLKPALAATRSHCLQSSSRTPPFPSTRPTSQTSRP